MRKLLFAGLVLLTVFLLAYGAIAVTATAQTRRPSIPNMTELASADTEAPGIFLSGDEGGGSRPGTKT